MQSREQELNTFLCFYPAKQDNSCEVDEASNLHAANVSKARSVVLSVLEYRERAFTLFPEIL